MYKKFREHLDKMSDWLEDNKAKLPRDEDEEEEEKGSIVAYMDGDPDEDDEKLVSKKNFDKKMFE